MTISYDSKMKRYTISSQEEMQKWGQEFAQSLVTPCIIELIGDLGAGKTTLVKGLGKGLGVKESIQSPSFTVFNHYKASNNRYVHHYDFYRLSDPGIMKHDLYESINNPEAITVIEWAQSVQAILPLRRIVIKIDYDEVEDTRVISCESLSEETEGNVI